MNNYELIKQEYIPELNSDASILKHKKSGAKIFFVSNDDENKVFTIGFRTPPANDTGVPHILEHSVLCGSKKFPLKDPFVELVKGSLNTFLNAMTYSDKTIYPIASCNDKDFRNLTDVYLDAVFHPNIYKNKKIFLQEGWHYELEDVDAPLKVNGVVYNEMKGVYSTPETYLDSYMMQTLFPNNTYGVESGGAPEHIPELSYEEFLAFHKKYYHPSNSYIYFYGNMDKEETLAWLDENYLSEYEAATIDSTIPKHEAFKEVVTVEKTYPALANEPVEKNYFAWNSVVSDALDKNTCMAFEILDYVLVSASGAVLRRAILDAELAKDITGGFESGILQPFFGVTAREVDPSRLEEFKTVIKETLEKVVEEGISLRSLEAGINIFEFKCREGDYGSYPKGLLQGIKSFESWLYDENDPFMYLKYEDTFEFLRGQMTTGYFEKLIKEWLIDNPYQAFMSMKPEKGLIEKNEEKLASKLQAYKESLSKEELQKLVEETKELRKYQDTPDSEEVIKLLPMLSREDIKKTSTPFDNEEKEVNGYKLLYHRLNTSGIGYLNVLFDTANLKEEEILCLGLLKAIIGGVDTANYTYQELLDEILSKTGGINETVGTYENRNKKDEYIGCFRVNAKFLYEKVDFALGIIKEMLLESKIRDDKRIYEILCQLKSKAEITMVSSGHVMATLRAASYYSANAYYDDCTGGIRLYHFVLPFVNHFEEQKENLYQKLESVMKKLFCKERMLISYTADEKGIELFEKNLSLFDDFKVIDETKKYFVQRNDANGFKPVQLNEGFKTSSQVQYVARCGNFKGSENLPYTGALNILSLILNYEYLWINLRVKGGAYGCMSGFSPTGESHFVSFRDPHLKQTNEVYEKIVDYMKNFDADEREMTKYIIGTISNRDVPLTPRMRGERSLNAYLIRTNLEQIQEGRMQILKATPEDIRALAPYIENILAQGAICAIGNEAKVVEDGDLFKEVKSLLADEEDTKEE